MRKSFTRLFSIFILLCGLSLQIAYGLSFDGPSSKPANANANVKPADIATKFVVAFDVAPTITTAGGTAALYRNGVLYKTYPVTTSSSSVQVVGKTLEITHGLAQSSFVEGDIYSVAITDGAITSLGAGALAQNVYAFTIGDWVNPLLVTTAASYSPAKGAVDVMANLDGSAFSLKIPFSEAVTVPTANNIKAIYVYAENGTVVDIIKVGKIGATTLCSDAALATPLNAAGAATIYVPVASTAIFKENTKYYVKIDDGALVDVHANKMPFGGLADATTWTFTTRDNSAPVISAKSVTSVATTSATLNVTLSEVGKYYYSVSPSSAAAPSAAQVIAGSDPNKVASGSKTVSAAATNVTASIAGLTGGVEYKIYIVTENSVSVGAPVTSATPASLTFTTVDNTAPSMVAHGTLINSDKKTYALYMVFNEQVKGQSGNLDLRLVSNDSYVKTVGASNITSRKITAAEVTANTFGAGRTVNEFVTVVDLGSTLPSKVGYYITFPATYIEDIAGNDYAGAGFIVPINKGDWGFISSDFEVPVVTVAWANAASLSSAINISFDETVYKQLATTSAWSEVVALEKDNVAIPFTVAPAAAAPTTAITITPVGVLSPNTSYTVRLRYNAIKDNNDNAITTEKVYTLTTGDLAAFATTYGSSLGATTTTNLVASSTIVIDFNKTVKVNTTGTTWVAATADNLKPFITFTKGGTAKAFTVAYDDVNFTVTITPTDALVCNASDYVVTLDGAKVKDSQGALLNTAAGYVAAQGYTVKDYNAPVAVASHSGDVSNDVAHATPKITFTDDNLATLTDLSGTALTALTPAQLANLITFKSGSSNGSNLAFTAAYAAGVITITPSVALVSDNTYYYGIGASVKDVAGNVSTGAFATFKAVAPAVAPTITALTYGINGGTQTDVTASLINIVPNSSNKVVLSVTFNDFVKEFTGNPVSLFDGVSTWNVNITSANVSGKVLTVEFPTGAALASDAVCTVTLPAALVQGSNYIAGTSTFAQFAGKIITFNSKDIVKPTASANTPLAAATAVALNTALKINFDEKVVLGTGNILIKEGATVVQTIPVNATNVTLDATGTVATITKSDLVKYNTTYTVEIPVTAFTDDISLNQLSAVYSGTFTTLVNPQPTIATYIPADDSDNLALTPLSLGITFSEEVIKYDPLSGTRKLWYLIEEGSNGIRCSFDANNDLKYNAGNDVVVANNYIETSSVGISGKDVTITTGFTPVAGKRYYVLITPGAFLDKSTGTSTLANPIPGVFAGVTAATTWNFTTLDVNAGTVAFSYTKRSDNLVATTSNITITFSRPIVKADGSAINDIDIANLFTLTKTSGAGTLGVKAFIGTISADKKIVTVLNSSLVTLGEMTPCSSFTIAMNPAAIKYSNGSAVAGASDSFTTSNYTAPSVAVSIAAPIANILKDKATVTFVASANTLTNGVQTNMKKLYYTIEAGSSASAAMTASVIKLSSTSQDLTGVAPLTKTYQFTGLSEKTSYVVYAVVEDEAGNTSPIQTLVFTTDDVTKPTLAVKPTSFDSNSKLTFEFSEAVTVPAGNLAVRILDKATLSEVAKLNLNAVAGAGNEKKLITDAFAGLAITNSIVNYYVEIDANIVEDVPVVAGDATNKFAGLFRTDCEVTSKDVTAPVLVSTNPALPAVDVNTNFSIQLTFSEPVQKVASLPSPAFTVEKEITPGSGTYEAFEVVDPANVVTNGTNVVTISVSRTLASMTKYRLTANMISFKDLAGNVCAPGLLNNTIVTKDVVAPTATFAPANSATGVTAGPAVLSLTFNEAIRLLDNTVIDSYDLDSLVWVKKGTDLVPFTATINPAATVISIAPTAALVADATYSYGFKAKFEDSYNNVVTAASASFKTVVTSPAAQYLTWTPTKVTVAPWSWLGTKDAVTLKFSSAVFTHSVVAAQNNLPVNAAWLAANSIVVEQDGVVVPAANLVFTVVDNQTFTVAPKTSWGSYSVIEVKVNGGTLQVNEGDITVLGTIGTTWDSAKFQAEDTVDPIVDILTAPAPFIGGVGYLPAMVGVDAVAPVFAKTETLKLYFSEDVKAGTATYEIYRWDGKFITSGTPTVAADNRTVSLGSLVDLPTNVEYFVLVNSGAVVDVHDNNPYAGITAVKTWKFLLKDTATPLVASYLPNTDNIPVDRDLTITFDRPVVLSGNGYVALYKTVDGGSAVQLWRGADNGTTNAFTVSGNTATVNLNNLDPNTKYYVELAEGTFVSAADGTIAASGKDRASWSFTTEVNAIPVATAFVPAKDATTVTLGSDLVLTFDQPVIAGTGEINIMVKQATGGYINNVTPISVTDATKVIFKDNTLTIPASVLSLKENSQYYVIIPATAVKNTSYTPEYFAGVLVPFAWSFSTVTDATAPTVTVTDPATPIAKVFTVGLTFSEPVTGVASGVTVTNGTAVVTGSGAQYSVTVTSEEQKVVTIVLANTIKDLATPANAFAGKTLSYTTADMTAPKAVATTPTGTLTNNHPTLVVTFDENVVFGAGKLNIYKKSDNTLALAVPVSASMVSGKVATVTYTYSATLKNGLDKNTDYYVLADAGLVKDLAGNAFAGITTSSTWTFKTGDFATGNDPEINNSLEFKVYPNPFVDYVTISNASELSKVVITNIAGQVVKEVVYPDGSIQLNDLRSGVYFVTLYQDNEVVSTVKLLKR